MPMRFARLLSRIIAALLALLGPPLAFAQDGSNLDEPLCPAWIERLLFDSYRNLANQQGRPQKSWAGVTFEGQSFRAQDGTEIYGYRAFAEAQEPERQPALVIVPGNAMLADQLYAFAAYFALHDFTAYIFDYRGYGGSAGVPQSHALVKDFREILARVAGNHHPKLSVYALSFGGVISLVALADAPTPDAMVLDGVPSSLPWYAFCPDWLNPVETVTHAPERTLVVSGTADPVVPVAQMAPLRERAGELGMQSRVVEGFSHPGIDDPETTLRRLELVLDFLRGPEP
jgi:alpha-beta hydrolase superfamily lysophospholipase